MRPSPIAGFLVLSILLLPLTPLWAQAGKNEKNEKKAGKKNEEKKSERETRPAKKKEGDTVGLKAQGSLGSPAKGGGDFYEFTYTALDGKKAAAKKIWLKIGAGTVLLRDRAVGLEAFKEGEQLWVFGKPVERESGGVRGVPSGNNLRLLQASRVVIGGKDVSVNEGFSDSKDKKFEWCETTVGKAGPAMTVQFGGGSYKVTLDKGAAILMRGEGDLKRDVRKGTRLIVWANPAGDKPPGEEDDRPAFEALRLVVVEPRSLQWYEALFSAGGASR